MSTLLSALSNFAVWKKGTILIWEDGLHVITEVSAISPDALSMKPEFIYTRSRFVGVTPQGGILLNSHNGTIDTGDSHYKVASQTEIDAIVATLPVIKLGKGGKIPSKYKRITDI